MRGGPRHGVEWTDRQMLDALDLMERQGLSGAEVAVRVGRSRAAVLGMVKRIRDDLAAVPDLTVKPENRDGAMPARWWANGRVK